MKPRQVTQPVAPVDTAPTETLTMAQARRIALAAQGFHDRRPEPFGATMRHVQRVIDRVGIIQIDSVNVLARSQYLPLFSRLGPYDTALLDRARDVAPRRLVEYWAHEASLIPPATWPHLTFRMRRAEADSWGGMQRVAREQAELVATVEAEVRAHGPLTAREVESRLEHDIPRSKDNWGWNWSAVKNALEHLFWAGRITSAGRTTQFERRYAAVESSFPPAARAAASPDNRPPLQQSFVELVRIAARAHGIGSELCLRDYFRLKGAQARPAIDELVRLGELRPVQVRGWKRPAYLHVDAARPRRTDAEALLSPFDSLVWQRDRTHELFDFHYRIEIYTPAADRVHGYYVLPFLHGGELVGRVDLKADRKSSVLRAQRISWEPRVSPAAGEALGRNLRSMADWLELTDVAMP
ncbi:winged helix-turn-helix domain-containing protein [Calidifontibacter indicus]|uniref:winged helix-turn-helix domain-containing protein n=1 Tax=Calidifontibacter indicus TaxID=419650 RepID=UPI003D74156B